MKGYRNCIYVPTRVKNSQTFLVGTVNVVEWDGITFAFLTAAVLVVCTCLAGCCPNCMSSIFVLQWLRLIFYNKIIIICL